MGGDRLNKMAEEKKPRFVITKVEVEGRTSEVMVQTQEPLPKWEQVSAVGKPEVRADAFEKVTGRARYTHDLSLPSMVWARIVRSPHPHARIVRIDASKALALPGVVGVLLPDDVKDYKIGNESNILCLGEARYVGEEVAAVAAVTEEIAADAAQLVQVEYQELPAVTDAEEAMRSGAPVVKEGGNIWGGKPRVYQRGDVAKGFAEADHIVEETFSTAAVHHACMETHCSICAWSGDELTVYESTQGIFGVQEAVARSLRIPSGKVRVICAYMGGGFGSKGGSDKYTLIAALFARKLQRPVKVVLTRQEDFIAAFYRPPSIQTLKIGVKKDGTLTAVQLKAINQVGAYQRNASWGSCEDPAAETYACANVRTEGYAVHTHMPIPSAMRGPGKTQGAWAMEQMMDLLAEKLSIDPVELRMKNYARTEPITNLPYASNGLEQCYKVGAEKFGWSRRKKNGEEVAPNKKRGVGVATQVWGGGGGPPAMGIVKIHNDASVELITGAADIGTGTRTVLAQIVAEELQVKTSLVHVINGDTATTPYVPPSVGSRTLATAGPACRHAAADALRQMKELAASLLGVSDDAVSYSKGEFRANGKPDAKLTFEQAAAKLPNRDLIGYGHRGPNPDGQSLRTFGAQFAEVEVDTMTGEVNVLRIISVHDNGRIINPRLWESQMVGGIAMGLGFALTEARMTDPKSGRPLSPDFYFYKVPTSLEMPDQLEAAAVPVPYDANDIGAKGAGEPPLVPTAPAIANAVANAVGVRIFSTPITPDKVLAALSKP